MLEYMYALLEYENDSSERQGCHTRRACDEVVTPLPGQHLGCLTASCCCPSACTGMTSDHLHPGKQAPQAAHTYTPRTIPPLTTQQPASDDAAAPPPHRLRSDQWRRSYLPTSPCRSRKAEGGSARARKGRASAEEVHQAWLPRTISSHCVFSKAMVGRRQQYRGMRDFGAHVSYDFRFRPASRWTAALFRGETKTLGIKACSRCDS